MSGLIIRGLQASGLYRIVRDAARALTARLPGARRLRRRRLAFFRRFIHSGELVFDVGANAGERTELFLALGARVVAVDPQPTCLRRLRRRFGRDPRVTVVDRALGAAPGEAEMLIAEADTISSLSPEWVASVRRSGRFADYSWNRRLRVPVTTLDALIAEHGRPVFVKIDVEGFEDAVLQGLSRPLRMVSFEFTPEHRAPALAALRRLAALGPAWFNYSVGDTLRWAWTQWLEAGAALAALERLGEDPTLFADIYARGDAP